MALRRPVHPSYLTHPYCELVFLFLFFFFFFFLVLHLSLSVCFSRLPFSFFEIRVSHRRRSTMRETWLCNFLQLSWSLLVGLFFLRLLYFVRAFFSLPLSLISTNTNPQYGKSTDIPRPFLRARSPFESVSTALFSGGLSQLHCGSVQRGLRFTTETLAVMSFCVRAVQFQSKWLWAHLILVSYWGCSKGDNYVIGPDWNYQGIMEECANHNQPRASCYSFPTEEDR